jgi:hypothetical protein
MPPVPEKFITFTAFAIFAIFAMFAIFEPYIEMLSTVTRVRCHSERTVQTGEIGDRCAGT